MTGVPKGERMNISFIGRINAGKSSVINSLIGQDISIVSEFPGTTTDPVAKRYELIPIGPVTIYDTAGYDDTTNLGEKRIKATLKVLFRSDLVVLVLDINGLNETDKFYINKLNDMKMPYIVVWNKSDLEAIPNEVSAFFDKNNIEVIPISTIDGSGIDVLKEKLVAKIQKLKGNENKILADIIDKEDLIVLVIPIDESAPKGRIILPQVQVIREILDCGAIAVCSREIELSSTLATLKGKIKLVITDSQAIDFVSKTVPDDILLTTFSTLFARYRGDLLPFLDGLEKLKTLKAGDKVLIAEACSHHSMGDDIGRVKIPNWVNKFLGFDLTYTNVNGHDFPDDLEKYKLVIHCGGCMMTRMEILRRINECQRRGVSITNYGMLISFVHGDLQRVIKVFNLKV